MKSICKVLIGAGLAVLLFSAIADNAEASRWRRYARRGYVVAPARVYRPRVYVAAPGVRVNVGPRVYVRAPGVRVDVGRRYVPYAPYYGGSSYYGYGGYWGW